MIPKITVLFVFVFAALILSAAETAPKFEPAAANATADAPPQLRGLLSMKGERLFSLVAPGGASARWVKLGTTFDGWELADFKSAEEWLVLKKGARTVVLKLEGSSITNAPDASPKATLEDAEEVFRKMDVERMMARMIEQQKAIITKMTQRLSQGAEANGIDKEEMAAFQKKTMDATFEAMNFAQIKNDMVKVYSETFTRDELRGLADFYSTPAGQAMVEKQPIVSQKINDLMMPRLMAALPKIQAMGKEFFAKQAAKREAAAPAPKE